LNRKLERKDNDFITAMRGAKSPLIGSIVAIEMDMSSGAKVYAMRGDVNWKALQGALLTETLELAMIGQELAFNNDPIGVYLDGGVIESISAGHSYDGQPPIGWDF